jgi:hypothetical protein
MNTTWTSEDYTINFASLQVALELTPEDKEISYIYEAEGSVLSPQKPTTGPNRNPVESCPLRIL